jgi:hypothetical protein
MTLIGALALGLYSIGVSPTALMRSYKEAQWQQSAQYEDRGDWGGDTPY